MENHGIDNLIKLHYFFSNIINTMNFELTRKYFNEDDDEDEWVIESVGNFSTRKEAIDKANKLRREQIINLLDADAINIRKVYEAIMHQIDEEFEDNILAREYIYKLQIGQK